MTDHQFTEGQRVWHRQRRQFGTYIEPAWTSSESMVAFPGEHVPGWPDEDDVCRVTTAQRVPADEVTA
jgi:hypothetical protein